VLTVAEEDDAAAVDHDAGQTDGDHARTRNLDRVPEPVDRLDEDPGHRGSSNRAEV
jgi:hypothetical protein